MKPLMTFLFYHKYSSAVLTLSDYSYDEAKEQLSEIVKDVWFWRCDNEDGEEE